MFVEVVCDFWFVKGIFKIYVVSLFFVGLCLCWRIIVFYKEIFEVEVMSFMLMFIFEVNVLLIDLRLRWKKCWYLCFGFFVGCLFFLYVFVLKVKGSVMDN